MSDEGGEDEKVSAPADDGIQEEQMVGKEKLSERETAQRVWDLWMEDITRHPRVLVLGTAALDIARVLADLGFWAPLALGGMSRAEDLILEPSVQEQLLTSLEEGRFGSLLFLLPGGTFGRTFRPPARTRSHPEGNPAALHSDPALAQRVENENRYMDFVMHLIAKGNSVGSRIRLVWSRGSFLSIWPPFRRFLESGASLELSLLDESGFDGGARRVLQVGTDPEGSRKVEGLSAAASPEEAAIVDLGPLRKSTLLALGSVLQGAPRSEYQKLFPDALLEEEGVRSLWTESFGKPPKEKPPPLSTYWENPDNFKVVIMGKWKRREHNNILEARVVLQSVRRAAREPVAWGKKVLVVTDNEAARGALVKGRSCSRAFLLACRRLAAITLGLRMRVNLRYIETSRMMADRPSRGVRRPGVYRKRRSVA